MRSGIDRVTRLQYRRQQLVTQTMILENQIGSLYASALQAKALYQQNMTVPYYRVQCNKAVRDYNRAKQTIERNQLKIINIDRQLQICRVNMARQNYKNMCSTQKQAVRFANGQQNRAMRGMRSAILQNIDNLY